MRAPVPYFGSKGLLAPTIAAALDSVPHRHYVEACGGGLSVLLAKRRAHAETANDIDGRRLVTFWRVLRSRPEDLERACSLTPHSAAERALALDFPPDLDELEVARRVYVALTQGRSGTLRNTGWRYDVDPDGYPYPVRLQRFAGRLAPAAARLAAVSLESRPAADVIAVYGRARQNLLYVDPPYELTARSRNYSIEMTAADHSALAEACLAADAAVVVSGYPGGVWDDTLAGWYRYELAATTTQGTGDRARTEILWANRPLTLPGVSTRTTPSRVETPTRCPRCPGCAAVLRQPRTGRRRVWCAPACRERARRALAREG